MEDAPLQLSPVYPTFLGMGVVLKLLWMALASTWLMFFVVGGGLASFRAIDSDPDHHSRSRSFTPPVGCDSWQVVTLSSMRSHCLPVLAMCDGGTTKWRQSSGAAWLKVGRKYGRRWKVDIQTPPLGTPGEPMPKKIVGQVPYIHTSCRN